MMPITNVARFGRVATSVPATVSTISSSDTRAARRTQQAGIREHERGAMCDRALGVLDPLDLARVGRLGVHRDVTGARDEYQRDPRCIGATISDAA